MPDDHNVSLTLECLKKDDRRNFTPLEVVIGVQMSPWRHLHDIRQNPHHINTPDIPQPDTQIIEIQFLKSYHSKLFNHNPIFAAPKYSGNDYWSTKRD